MSFLSGFAKWLYFFAAFFSIIGSFIHLNIQFDAGDCTVMYKPQLQNHTADCIGRNLVWVTYNPVGNDYNNITWRKVFSLEPDIFVDIWTPFFLSTITTVQHFKGGKFDPISGSWIRALLWIVFWNTFAVTGYAGNWGVAWGLVTYCLIAPLYFLLMFIGSPDDPPVLQIDLSLLLGKYLPGFAARRAKVAVPDEHDPNAGNDNFGNGFSDNNVVQ